MPREAMVIDGTHEMTEVSLLLIVPIHEGDMGSEVASHQEACEDIDDHPQPISFGSARRCPIDCLMRVGHGLSLFIERPCVWDRAILSPRLVNMSPRNRARGHIQHDRCSPSGRHSHAKWLGAKEGAR